MRRTLLILLLCPLGCRQATPTDAKAAPVDRLLSLIHDRLDVMHDVAWRKWTDKKPIEDPAREARLLEDVETRGKALGLDPARTRAFFTAQIEAAKFVQHADFARWEKEGHGPVGEAPDLAGVLRPKIDALNRDILAALADLKPTDAATIRDRANTLLADIDAAVRDLAIRSLVAEGR